MDAGDTIYVVWAQTDDFYDQGQYVSFHKTRHGANVEAARLPFTKADTYGTFERAEVHEVELKE